MHLRLALLGFGNINKALARLLLDKRAQLKADYGFSWAVTGIATLHHGIAIEERGLDLEHLLPAKRLASDSQVIGPDDIIDYVRICPADVLIEATPCNPKDGQPAVDYLRTAIQAGLHVITANKGPIAHAYSELQEAARQAKRTLFFEATVMGGTPVIRLARDALAGTTILGFRGILNFTTNYVLGLIEKGCELSEAVREAQKLGIVESDPSLDLDGWDGALKTTILANVLMGGQLRPRDVPRTTLQSVEPAAISMATRPGGALKQVCQAERIGSQISAAVTLQFLAPEDPLAHISGVATALSLETDVLREVIIVEARSGLRQSAYGLLGDLIAVARTAA